MPLGKPNGVEHLLYWNRNLAKLELQKSFLKKLQSLKMFFETWPNVNTFAFLRVLTLFVVSSEQLFKIPLQGKQVGLTFCVIDHIGHIGCDVKLKNTLRNATTNAQQQLIS